MRILNRTSPEGNLAGLYAQGSQHWSTGQSGYAEAVPLVIQGHGGEGRERETIIYVQMWGSLGVF